MDLTQGEDDAAGRHTTRTQSRFYSILITMSNAGNPDQILLINGTMMPVGEACECYALLHRELESEKGG